MNDITKKDLGEFLIKSATGLSESIPEDGGHLLTRYMVDQVFDALKYDSIIFNKARKFYVANSRGNGIKVPYSTTPLTNEPNTGTRAYWIAEAADKTISKPQLGVADMQFAKLVVRVPVTDELLQDAALLADFVIFEAARAITYKVEREAIFGVGKSIKGVAGDGDYATLVVDTSADITEAEIKNYVAALNPLAYKGAEWYIAPQQFDNICSINYTNETGLVFEDGRYYLFGFPVNVVAHLTADPYGIVLGDFSAYGLAIRGPSIAISDDIRFLNDESEIRVVLRIAGAPLTANMTLDDTNTYAFFVVPDGGEANASSSSSSSSSESSESSSSSSSSSEGYSSESSSSEGYSSESSSSGE